MAEILLGTSGYDYPEWKGVFYPEDLKRKDFLPYYASVFNALELNFSFYSMPKSATMLDFNSRADGRLQFSVKANRLLTHEISSDWHTAATDFKTAVRPLLEKGTLSSVLFQFPQSFHYIPKNRLYLSDLLKEFEGFPVVVEFRHQDWIRESVFAGLTERKTSVAFCDMPQLKYLPNGENNRQLYSQFIGPQAYIRLHGRNADAWYGGENGSSGLNPSARYDYSYSAEELAGFVPIVRVASDEGRKVLIFFNNHPKGSGARNAQELRTLLNS